MPNTVVDTVQDTLLYNSVGWEADGLFRVSTRLIGRSGKRAERAIDPDDRDAYLLVSIEMASNPRWEWKATEPKAVLVVDGNGANTNIALDGVPIGEVVLFDHALPNDPKEIFPGGSITRTVKVQTGVFATPKLNTQSASSGTKDYRVKLTYKLEPLIGTTRQTTHSRLVFFVAGD